VPEAWAVLAEQHGDLTAVIDTHHEPATQLTYSELRDAIFSLARGLQRLGLRWVSRGE
jgi:long-subunit acyl-CoA synthetase (AMP-forming)